MMESAQGEGRASSMDGGGGCGDGGAQLQGTNSAAGGDPDGGDWRALLPPVTRKRVVIMLKDTLRKHLPISVLVRCEIQKEAVRIEEMLYAAATSETEYMRTVFREKLSMENQTEIRQAPVNAEVIPDQNPGGPAPGLLPQGSNPGELPVAPLMSQQAASLPMLGQSMQGFSQTSSPQDMSGVPRNTMNEGFTQGNPQDIISAGQRKLVFQQLQMLMNLRQHQKPPTQQQNQQQSTPVLSTQQSMIQKFYGLQPGQCTIPDHPIQQLNILPSPQQQLQSIGKQSIYQHGSVSGALQQESTLPMLVQSSHNWMSTMQPNNANSMQANTSTLLELPRQKQEELIRMNDDMQRRQWILHETQLQLKAQQLALKLQQRIMQATQHLPENDVNELKEMYLVVYLLLSIGVLVAMLFMVYNHWWDLWQV